MRTERPMVFVRRAATVALLTFASALAGFGVQGFLPASYVVESRSMVGSGVGLVAARLDREEPRALHQPAIAAADDRTLDHPTRFRAHRIRLGGYSGPRAVARSCQEATGALVGGRIGRSPRLLSRRPARGRAGNARLFRIAPPYERRTKTRSYERERSVWLDRRHANDDGP